MKTNNETVNEAGTVAKTAEAKTLRELGIDGALAAEFELVWRLMGAVDGDRVVGYTFTAPDGQRHALRVEKREAPGVARAA